MTSPEPRPRTFRRALTITTVVLTYGVFYRFTSLRRKSFGARLQLACQKLGVVFVKIGQLLSGRYDLLSEEDMEELKKLLDRANPVAEATMHEIIEQELGTMAKRLGPLTLLSSASIAQVYASMLDGHPVVVKVLRPGIREQAELDFGILYRLAAFAEKMHIGLKRMSAARSVLELRDGLLEEADLSNELANMELFRGTIETAFGDGPVRPGLGVIRVPRTYPEFSTARVLVMERFSGVTASDWTRGIRPVDCERYDAQTSILTLFAGSMRPIFESKSYLFHGDPHPANVVILEGGDVGLIDFGLVGRCDDPGLIRAANRLYFAIYLKNAELATRALLQFVQMAPHHYEEILPDMRRYVEEAERKGFGDWLKGSFEILRAHKLSMHEDIDAGNERSRFRLPSVVVKFTLLVDSLAHDFFPGRSTAELLGPELRAGILSQAMQNLSEADPKITTLGLLYAFSEIVSEGPELIGKALARFV